jgi:hypothetical protein
VLTLTIEGVRLVSETNQRSHWSARHRRNRGQQELVRAALVGVDKAPLLALPRLRVVLTRVMGKRGRPFDRDNLWSSMKHTIDAVASWAGKPDHDPFWVWEVSPTQERGPEFAVRLTFAPAAG